MLYKVEVIDLMTVELRMKALFTSNPLHLKQTGLALKLINKCTIVSVTAVLNKSNLILLAKEKKKYLQNVFSQSFNLQSGLK